MRSILFLFAASIAVFSLLIYSLIKSRQSSQAAAHFHQSLTVDILWTAIPFVMIIALATPEVIFLFHA